MYVYKSPLSVTPYVATCWCNPPVFLPVNNGMAPSSLTSTQSTITYYFVKPQYVVYIQVTRKIDVISISNMQQLLRKLVYTSGYCVYTKNKLRILITALMKKHNQYVFDYLIWFMNNVLILY